MAAAVLACGIVLAAVLLFSFVDDLIGVSRFATGQPVEADLRAGTERTIYSEDPSTGVPATARPACHVIDVATARAVPTRPAGLLTLTLGDDVYQSLAHFDVDRDGRYRIECSASAPLDMAVGPRLQLFRSAGRIVAAIGTGLVALALGATIIAVTAVKRHRRRKGPQARPVP